MGKEEQESLEDENLKPLEPNEKARMMELRIKQTKSTEPGQWDLSHQDVDELLRLEERYQSKGEVSPGQRAA